MLNEIIVKFFLIALIGWVLAGIYFWLYFMYGAFKSGSLSLDLLRQVREVSPQTYEYLHRGNINPRYEFVPYVVLNGPRFYAFLNSDELDEYSHIKSAKAKYLEANAHVHLKRNLIIWLAVCAFGFIIIFFGFCLMKIGVLK